MNGQNLNFVIENGNKVKHRIKETYKTHAQNIKCLKCTLLKIAHINHMILCKVRKTLRGRKLIWWV